jgi:hypothetical protein
MYSHILPYCRVDPRDPCSRRRPVTPESIKTANRRGFLKLLGGSLLLPTMGRGVFSTDVLAVDFVSQGIDPAKLWDANRLFVFAYKQRQELGELCQRLDAAKEELPVSLIWRLPPDWVKSFPTIHFEVSSRRWKKYEGWQTPEHFVDFYKRYNPPPQSANQPSPFKQYVATYDGPEWTYPDAIDEHLLDPSSLHRFSKFELRELSKREMENLHAAHHEEQIEPGLRPETQGVQMAT